VVGSLDYLYLPTADAGGEVLRYVQTMGAELAWKVRAMGTTVACLGAGEPGPAVLLAGHLQGMGATAGLAYPGRGNIWAAWRAAHRS
jgi:hypothetical protein